MILTQKGVFLGISVPSRNVLDACNPIRNALKVFMSFTQLKVFMSFWKYSSISFCTSYLLRTHWGYLI